MAGSIYKQKNRDWWVVAWYHRGHKKQYKITKYKGELMYSRRIAEKLLATIQSRWEDHQNRLAEFRIEEFTGKGYTNVLQYFEEWLETKKKKKPATYKGYKSYYRNWIKPFFTKYPVMLHEIQLDTLDKMLEFIKLQPKGKYNVMNCFHSFMDYAWRSRKIREIPPFPKKSDYQLVEPTIKWLPTDRQMAIINAIPEQHQPIFLWLKYHLRRPSEACALMWEDYDAINRVFIIRRSISARKTVDSTKTGTIHVIPCHSGFMPVMDKMQKILGEHIFKNPLARRESKRYTNESLNTIWRKACSQAGESIDLYSGLKHSGCSQLINECGYSIHDVQQATDHKNIQSVRKYAAVEIDRKRIFLEGKAGLRVITTSQPPAKNGSDKNE